tara:strand:+ start:309 stop:584 length:276 start_codon:yes stop_codon:yes gene_type:complete
MLRRNVDEKSFRDELIKLIRDNNKTQYTAEDIVSVLEKTRDWFGSSSDCHIWFHSNKIPSFSGLTPLEVLERYNINVLNDFVDATNLGSYE